MRSWLTVIQSDAASSTRDLGARVARTRNFFDSVGAEWDAARKVFNDDALRAQAITRLVAKDLRVLDVGTGTGILAIELAGRQALRLELELCLSPENPRDEIDIDGKPPIKLSIPGGLPGELSTAAIMINCIPAVVRNEVSGLLSMRDLPVAPYRYAGEPLQVDSDE